MSAGDPGVPPVDLAAIDQPVTVAWRSPTDVDVVVAGVNIAPLVSHVAVHLDIVDAPRIDLELDPAAVVGQVTGTRIVLDVPVVDEWLRQALRAAGWAPVAAEDGDL